MLTDKELTICAYDVKDGVGFEGNVLKRGFIGLLGLILDSLLKNKFNKADRFSDEEIKRIRRIVGEQINNSDPWIVIDGIAFPKLCRFYRVKEGTEYRYTKAGSLVVSVSVSVTKEDFRNPEHRKARFVSMTVEGKEKFSSPFMILVNDVEPISEAEEQKLKADWHKTTPEWSSLGPGEAVELAKEYQIIGQDMDSALLLRLEKGLKGVIDEPKLMSGSTLDALNSPYCMTTGTNLNGQMRLYSGNKQYILAEADLRIPPVKVEREYKVYIPDSRSYLPIPRSYLKPREFDKAMFSKVLMGEDTRNLILALVNEDRGALEKWGINKDMRKGKGMVFLAYGPPGTGKTMTGEALAEYLEKPVYFADLSDFGSSIKSFEEGLKAIIEITEKWEAVTIIDEAELILESRQENPFDSSMRVAAVLRNLEKLEKGILWMTTNRPIVIDFAIESRIRSQIEFPPFTPEQRAELWKLTVPADMPIVPDLASHLDELVAIELNGREIRNVIRNAAADASSKRLEYVPFDYLLKWAKCVPESRETLRQTKQDGRRRQSIGFSHNGNNGHKSAEEILAIR